MTKTTTNGKKSKTFKELYDYQIENQNILFRKKCYEGFKGHGTNAAPAEDISLFSFHIQQLMSEIGEVLSSDKRWKNIRNSEFDCKNKLEEIADCFMVLMNVAMFSGFEAKDVEDAIANKMQKVRQRFIDE